MAGAPARPAGLTGHLEDCLRRYPTLRGDRPAGSDLLSPRGGARDLPARRSKRQGTKDRANPRRRTRPFPRPPPAPTEQHLRDQRRTLQLRRPSRRRLRTDPASRNPLRSLRRRLERPRLTPAEISRRSPRRTRYYGRGDRDRRDHYPHGRRPGYRPHGTPAPRGNTTRNERGRTNRTSG